HPWSPGHPPKAPARPARPAPHRSREGPRREPDSPPRPAAPGALPTWCDPRYRRGAAQPPAHCRPCHGEASLPPSIAPAQRRLLTPAKRRRRSPFEYPPQAVAVSDTLDTLILDFLEWLGPNPRPYAEVLEAWRTSCPRLPVWEDANERGFIAREHRVGAGSFVSVTDAGRTYLSQHRQPFSEKLDPATE